MKKKLKMFLKESMIKEGYIYINDSFFNPDVGLYYKILKNKYCLTIGFKSSRCIPGYTDGTYYLSKLPSWSSAYFFPIEAYQPMARYLKQDERVLYLPEEYSKEGMLAGAWKVQTENEVNCIIKTIELTEPRFLAQEGLFEKIDNCERLNNDLKNIAKAMEIYETQSYNNESEFHYLPEKVKDGTPLEWYKVSEIINKNNSDINKRLVERFAIEAYRQYTLPGLKELIR